MRVALGIRYKGSAFHGWQTQDELVNVQDSLEEALFQFTGERVSTVCAGRTDAGVHATSQVVDFETGADRPEPSWVRGVTRYLPEPAAVSWMRRVPSDFSSRFCALSRTYEYWIDNEPYRNPVTSELAAWVFRPLDVLKMYEASRCLIGQHDFSSFRAAQCQAKTPVRTVNDISMVRRAEMVGIRIRANAFLYHMVRNIVGALVYVGIGRNDQDWLKEVLEAKNRSAAAPTFSPSGLYLCGVEYPSKYGLPGSAPTPWSGSFKGLAENSLG